MTSILSMTSISSQTITVWITPLLHRNLREFPLLWKLNAYYRQDCSYHQCRRQQAQDNRSRICYGIFNTTIHICTHDIRIIYQSQDEDQNDRQQDTVDDLYNNHKLDQR